MTRDLLIIHASMVVLKYAFSVSGVISPRRTKLVPLLVEVCICLKDYLNNVEHIQNVLPQKAKL